MCDSCDSPSKLRGGRHVLEKPNLEETSLEEASLDKASLDKAGFEEAAIDGLLQQAGWNRRDFLRVGAIAPLGFSLANLLQAQSAPKAHRQELAAVA